MRQIVIATHGDFSKGIKQSLEMIVGEAALDIITYSLVPGENASDFSKELKNIIQKNKDKKYILLGDLFGASVVNSLTELTTYENVHLISGVNLNLALEIMLTPEDQMTAETLDNIVENSREGIKRVQVLETENEDF